MGLGGPWGDSFDPGDTYYGYSWNLVRNYARTLVMFKPAPGKQGLELVPDLATDLGKSSDGGKTWTYTIQKGLKYEDGSPITTKDIAYAVSRNVDRASSSRARATSPTADLAEGLQGPLQGSQGRRHQLGDRDPRRHHDRLPPQAAVRRVRLPRPAAQHRTGPGRQGHRQEVHDPPGLLGALHVEGQRRHQHRRHAGAQPQLGRLDRHEPQGAARPDRRQARPAGRRPGQPDHRR